MQKDDRYFLVTPPMEFIRDIRDIMSDGDNLAPERLVADVVDLLKNYTSQHNQSLEWQFLELGWNVEKLPASAEETEIIIALGELRERVKAVEQGLHLTGGILPPSEPLSPLRHDTGIEYLSHQPTSK